ncbi:hypothetical protein ACIQB5_31760 [Streptomyces sp. NPDC088560]|uniref:hypothetical protein n=1 Tax=Streptomyces sp. NPDC088560 TaxID=3365868 RepID=UPI00382FD538
METPSARRGQEPAAVGVGRRRFLDYVLAASTLTVAAELGEAVLAPNEAAAVVPSVPGPAEIYDLDDMLTHATLPMADLITTAPVVMNGTSGSVVAPGPSLANHPRCDDRSEGVSTETPWAGARRFVGHGFSVVWWEERLDGPAGTPETGPGGFGSRRMMSIRCGSRPSGPAPAGAPARWARAGSVRR